MKKGVVGLILILLIPSFPLPLSHSIKSTTSIIRVPQDYPTIQGAINAADPGDTILVASGVYYENIIIDKPISLIGESNEKTIIIGSGIGNVIYISSDNVTVSGFTIKGSGTNYISPFDGGDAGVVLDKVKNCTLSNLIVTENCLGIFLNLSSKNIIESNIVYLNRKDGIYLRMSSSNLIIGNNCSLNGGHGGIYLNPSSNGNLIENNIAIGNADHGIKLQESSNYNVLRNNTCKNNENAGIFLRTSDNNILDSNILIGNKHNPGIILYISCDNNTIINNISDSNNQGILVGILSNDNVLINNTVRNNKVRGIHIWLSNNNIITRNIISLNGESPHGTAGIYIDNSSYNEVYHNIILMNWRGIVIGGENSTENKIHQNDITRSVEVGLLNEAPTEVNATLNWWGHPSGPYHPTLNPSGKGDRISENVIFKPWSSLPIAHLIPSPPKRTDSGYIGRGLYFEISAPSDARVGDSIVISIKFYIRYESYIDELSIQIFGAGVNYSRNLVLDTHVAGIWMNYTVVIEPTEEGLISCKIKAKYAFIYGTARYSEYGDIIIRITYARMITYDELREMYEELQVIYNNLEKRYEELNMMYTTLDEEYYILMRSYRELKNTYDKLLTSYNDLKTNYDTLKSNYKSTIIELKKLSKELDTTRIFVYLLTLLTSILIITILYLKRIKFQLSF